MDSNEMRASIQKLKQIAITHEDIEKIAYLTGQIADKNIKSVIIEVLVEMIQYNITNITNADTLFRLISRMINQHQLTLGDKELHQVDSILSDYLLKIEDNQNLDRKSTIQSISSILHGLQDGQQKELKKTIEWSLSYMKNQLTHEKIGNITSNMNENEEIICRMTVLLREIGLTVGLNDNLTQIFNDVILRILQFFNNYEINKMSNKFLSFNMLMCGRNSIYNEKIMNKAKKEVVNRFKQRQNINLKDFCDIMASFHIINAIDEQFLNDMELLNGNAIKEFQMQNQPSDFIKIFDILQCYTSIIPNESLDYYLKFLSQIQVEQLNIIDLRMVKNAIEYLLKTDYMKDSNQQRDKITQLQQKFKQQYNSKSQHFKDQSLHRYQPSLEQSSLIEDKVVASLMKIPDLKLYREQLINDKYHVDLLIKSKEGKTILIEVFGPTHFIKQADDELTSITPTKELNGKSKFKIDYYKAFNLNSIILDYRDIQDATIDQIAKELQNKFENI